MIHKPTDETSPQWRSLPYFARCVLIIAFIIVGIFYVDWTLVFKEFSFRHILAFLFSQPLLILGLFLVSLRFYIFCDAVLSQFFYVLRAYILSIGLNNFIPGRLTEILKITYLQKHTSIKASTTIGALVLERIIDVMFLGVFLLLGLGTKWIAIDFWTITFTLILFFIFLFSFPFFEKCITKIIDRFSLKSKIFEFLQSTLRSITERLNDPAIFLAIAFSLFAWFTSFLHIYLILYILYGADITLDATMVVFSAMALGRAIPGLPGGLGTFEAMIVLAMTSLGFTLTDSLVTALTIHASQIVLPTFLALIILFYEGTGLGTMLSEIRSMKNEN